jgi:hypothetical protein
LEATSPFHCSLPKVLGKACGRNGTNPCNDYSSVAHTRFFLRDDAARSS